MPKNRITDMFLSAARKSAAGENPPELAILKKRVCSPLLHLSSRPATSAADVAKPTRCSPAVSSHVLSRLKRASNDRKNAADSLSGDMNAVEISNEISSILRGVSDDVGLPCSMEPINEMLPKNILDVTWFTNMPDTCTTQRRKEVSRERKQKYIFKNTESRRFTKLMKMCADKLGTKSTFQIFGKLGRESGIKEYNALIKLCIDKARTSMHGNDEKESLVQIHEAYQLLSLMRERGFQIEEESFSPFLMHMIDMGMREEFQIFSELIKDQNPGSHFRIGFYEMLLWIRIGDEDKIRELCNSIGDTSSEDSYYFAESYLLAFCESDWKEEILRLLEVLDISRISSSKNLACIFKSLGRLQLESIMEKYIFALITGAQSENVSTLIYDYAISIPEIAVRNFS